MGKTCLCRASAAILLVASLVQLAAIASPGWTIFIEGNTETYHSVFYIMKCSTQGEYSCEFTTQAELYEEKKAVLDRHDATNNKFVRHVKDDLDRQYKHLLCKQVLLVTAAGMSFFVCLLQMCRRGKVDNTHTRLILLSVIVSAISVGIVLSILAADMVDITVDNEMLSHDSDRDHTFLGFPYSLAMMFGSVLLHVIADVTMGAHLYTPKDRVQKGRKISYEDYEEETIDAGKTNYSYDNTVLTEKL